MLKMLGFIVVPAHKKNWIGRGYGKSVTPPSLQLMQSIIMLSAIIFLKTE